MSEPSRGWWHSVTHAVRPRLVSLMRDSLGAEAREGAAQEPRALAAELAALREEVARVHELAASVFDDVHRLRRELLAVRSSEGYESALGEPEPLVTVRIATFNLSKILVERAIASVLAQTYQRFEIVVVGDGCTDDTEERIRALGDPRVRFVKLPTRAAYPADARARWMVAGSPAMNLGAQLAGGQWIAPLDDDDEFTPDHIEVLLRAAHRAGAEMSYGNLLEVRPGREADVERGVFPPRLGEFGFQAAMVVAPLRFFEYETRSWLVDEPGDWNLCRRMLEAGVHMEWADQVVTRYYPAEELQRRG